MYHIMFAVSLYLSLSLYLSSGGFVKGISNFRNRAIYFSKIPSQKNKNWDDGEVPWDIEKDDNSTTVKPFPPINPVPPITYEKKRNSKQIPVSYLV